jgi:hypothetical protein
LVAQPDQGGDDRSFAVNGANLDPSLAKGSENLIRMGFATTLHFLRDCGLDSRPASRSWNGTSADQHLV